ncbi:hypothetical protein HYU94_02105 [Candidatus Daviesbacteria bacterium]|nr:hypothetical protein [Candidatus Daviesbacteria bacterium]
MSERLLQPIKPVLGLDFDDTIVETTPAMKATFEWQYRGIFPSEFYEGKTPDSSLYPDLFTLYRQYSAARWGHMREASYITGIPPCGGVAEALSILNNFFKIHLNTARWIDQGKVVERYLDSQGWLKYIHSMFFRQIGTEDQFVAKSRAASFAGISYAAEDHAPLITYFADNNIKVAAIDNPANRGIPNSANIIRVQGFIDFARAVEKHGDPEELFKVHANELENPANLYKVHVFPGKRIFAVNI